MRIDAFDDYLPNGLTIEEVIEFCKMAKKSGVDVLDVSRGNIVTPASVYEVPPIDIPTGFNVDNAAKIRKETDMLTIAVGRINTAELAQQILEEDKADMIVMGRAQLADPQFCNKAKEGKVEDIIQCVACNQGCYDGFCDVKNRPFITCLRNPSIGHEAEYELKQADVKKTVGIIGGGMAGLEAARILNIRGHKAVIFEAGDHLGGQFITAGQALGKREMKDSILSLAKQVEKSGVEIHLNTVLTKEIIERNRLNEVILAIGSSPIEFNIEGKENKAIYNANNVLNGVDEIKGDTVVIGGGLVGLEVADYIASNKNNVTVIEMLDKAGKDLGSLRVITVMQKMKALNVDIHTNTKFIAINNEGAIVECDGNRVTIPCENVVVAVGSKSNNSDELVKLCEGQGIPYHIIGDAKAARRALNAVEEAFEVARKM